MAKDNLQKIAEIKKSIYEKCETLSSSNLVTYLGDESTDLCDLWDIAGKLQIYRYIIYIIILHINESGALVPRVICMYTHP